MNSRKFLAVNATLRTILLLAVAAAGAQGAEIFVGTVTTSAFLDGIQVNLTDLTGSFDFPPAFPVSTSLNFVDPAFSLPSCSAGSSGGTWIPGETDSIGVNFCSATYATVGFTLDQNTFQLYDGSTFTANSPAVSLTLLPVPGDAYLTPGEAVDVAVSGALTTVPESSSIVLLIMGLLIFAVAGAKLSRGRKGLGEQRPLTNR